VTERHILKSDGAWVELRDLLDVRARDRKKVMAIMTSAIRITDFTTGEMDADTTQVMQAYESGIPEAVAALLITAWEIPYAPDAKLPSIDVESLGDLRLDDYDRLMEIIQPAMDLLMPKPVSPDDYADPTSPSEPASV
jgi:hypothetical protein